ncbi:restriction endonuclease subunit S [Kiloniella litopenaei]|uniref:restriction endonuclease subunit S n=1 Tax=Kiloniella litopenaei TaxID=1549748 RepID=UPI0009E3B594|nr:restriction endonuclease subunit S [Kiloniella litopenaei]
MKSSYKRLGSYIREVDIRNVEGREDNLLGVSTQKMFIKSVANTVGTDFSRYKVVKRGQFTYVPDTSRRGDKIGLAMLDHLDAAIVSNVYTVFEVNDREELDPEYLMMWFRRPEFDRYARYMSHGSVREIFGWEEMCGVELPIPDIEIQREIVREYNVIVNRIKLNEQLCAKLEETAQALYKHWFVDFEFPISAEYASTIGKPELEGKPYKSSGGRFRYSDELDKDIPTEWELESLGQQINYKKGYAFKSDLYRELGKPIVRVSNFTKNSIDMSDVNFMDEGLANAYIDFSIKTRDIVISTVGSWPNNPDSIVGKVISVPIAANDALLNQNAVRLRAKNEFLQSYLYFSLSNKTFSSHVISGAQGSANQASVTLDHLFSFGIFLPPNDQREALASIFNEVFKTIDIANLENTKLLEALDLLMAKLSLRKEAA